MNGILLVDKPKGWTSFDVVGKVRSVLRTEYRSKNIESRRVKVGHTGTLDPAATGLLVLCIGKATKRVPTMIKHDKTYEVEMTLGATSTTGDQEGVITLSHESRVTSHEQATSQILESRDYELETEVLERLLQNFVGEQMQTPPIYSAIKVNGQRAYDLARAGKEVKLEPRKCTIYDLQLMTYDFPVATFTCSVSSGTYIRSLVEDIGTKLGTGAYMSELRRTKVNVYDVSQAIDPQDITFEQILEHLLP